MDNFGYEEHQEEQEINLRDYWRVIQKRKGTIFSFTIALVIVVAAASFIMSPTYSAKGTLLIEKEPNILTFQDIFQIDTLNDDYYQTQYRLLQSRALAGDTIERLKLYENRKFAGRPNPDMLQGDKVNPLFQSKLIDKFLGRLSIKPIRQTRLVEVSFKDHDPKFAADTLNTLFNSFIDMNVQLKYEATEQATEFLTGQIAAVTSEIAADEKKMQEYGVEKNIVSLSDKETTILEKLGGLNRALTEAQIDRVKKEAYYNEIKIASPDYIPEALNNLLIQRLREDYAKLSTEYSKKQETFKPDYPEMIRLRTELDAAKEALKNETQNFIKGAYSDFQAALKKERSLGVVFNNQKDEAVQLNSNAILYNSLKIEIENKKNLLDSLQKRQNETGISAKLKGLRTSNVRIVDKAEVPRYPSSPKKKLNILLALLIGLLGGVGLAFLFEYLDNSIKTFEDVEKYTGLPSLGIIPAFYPDGQVQKPKVKVESEGDKKEETGQPAPEVAPPITAVELIAHYSPKSTISENYRSIRTTLFLSSADAKFKALIISSPLPQEGKTATISNLGVTLAQADKRVVILDCDLRKPRLHKIFKLKNLNGVTNYLSAGIDLRQLVKQTLVPNLFLINAGPVPPNPVELLGSARMAYLVDTLKKHFDYVLFDTPPILAVSDAIAMGPHIDGAILVVWGGKTSRDALKRAAEKLETHKIKCLGVIINNIDVGGPDYNFLRHYYKYYGQQ